MQEGSQTQTNNDSQENQVKYKQTLNAGYCRSYYRKHHPELPRTKDGKRYNPKFKWNALALENPGVIYFKTYSEVDAYRRALTRLGIKSKSRKTNLGFKVWRVGDE